MRIALAIATVLGLLAGSVFGARDFTNAGNNVFSTNTWYGGTVTNFTLSAWIKQTPPYGAGGRVIAIISRQDAGKAIYLNRNGSSAVVRGGEIDGANHFIDSSALTSNEWHHVALVRSSTTNLVLYVDGSSAGSVASAMTYTASWATNIAVGNYAQGYGGNPYQGQIAEVAFWGVGLSSGEVTALASGQAPPRIRPAALMTYLPLYGHGGTTNPEIDVIRGPLGRYGGTTNPVEAAHPRIYR